VFYREYTVLEDDDIKVHSFEVFRARVVVVEAAEADKHVVLEDFTLFSRFLSLDVFGSQGMDTEYLHGRKQKSE
jgi:hypothetical protein